MENTKVKHNYTYELIPLSKIVPNKANFYSVEKDSIEQLANTILEVGLLHDIVVVKINNDPRGRYKIISGERRYMALKLLKEQNKHNGTIMCKILNDVDDIDSQIALIRGNSNTRILSNFEKRKQQEELERLYKAKEENIGKKLPIQKLVSEDLGMSVRNTRRIGKINSYLIEELKELYDTGKITLVSAEKFASYDEDGQYIIYEGLKAGITLTQSQIDIVKKENIELINQVKDTNSELKHTKNILDNKINESNILKDKLEKANLSLNEIKNNIDDIKQSIIDEQRKENEEKVLRLKADLDNLMLLHKKLQSSKKSLEISLTEKDLILKKEKSELHDKIKQLEQELNIKREEIKFDHEEKAKEIKKNINKETANQYKEDIISLIQKISDLDYLEEEDLLDIVSDIKAFIKILV